MMRKLHGCSAHINAKSARLEPTAVTAGMQEVDRVAMHIPRCRQNRSGAKAAIGDIGPAQTGAKYCFAMQDAMRAGALGLQYYEQQAQKLERKLQAEIHRDALSEVYVIKHNVLQAFLESAADPSVLHAAAPISPVRPENH
jgi:hypothetical protein